MKKSGKKTEGKSRKKSVQPSVSAKRATRASRRVFFFGDGKAEGHTGMKELLGSKGANLAEMVNIGIPVPPGFTISTEVCAAFNADRKRLPSDVNASVLAAIRRVEKIMGAKFGDPKNPLLFSVRSGARASMPGMMDTVLNLGLNHQTVLGLAACANARFAYDSYRRFIQMYGDVVLGVPHERFEGRLELFKEKRNVDLDTELRSEDLQELVSEYLQIIADHTGAPFPQDPEVQLWGAIGAVFDSWENDRARRYRRLHGIPSDWGTAVNVQAMVFGNMGDTCATGVAFTRDPSTGANIFYGEYLKNAQGEDVVAGIRTPQPINEASKTSDTAKLPTLEKEMPHAYRELVRLYQKIEKHYREMQDIEFTIQDGKLWILQTRTGKRTSTAAVRIAVEMVKERLISKEEALLRIDAGMVDQLLYPTLDPKAKRTVIAQGLPASPGAAVGKIVFSADEAEAKAKIGERVVLVRIETSPEDIHGMHAAQGILTARGGMTSHAAVVARGLGKCCVSGCGSLRIDYAKGEMRVGEYLLRAGDMLTLDGGTGEVILGAVPTVTPKLGAEFGELMRWADQVRKLGVRTNADTPSDAKTAREFGAEGIGLCRTEHMFFEADRIQIVREMILASDTKERNTALDKLFPIQRSDFVEIFKVMAGLPVTVRLLDPPLHEFLPHAANEIAEVARGMGVAPSEVEQAVEALHESNPMLGHRGCRLAITYPEIYRMQVRAIVEAACQVKQKGVDIKPEIMIPLIANAAELARLRALVEAEVATVLARYPKLRLRPHIGTMIEVPRAALTADAIAEHAEFFSFGTNDLTQTSCALSRDDAGRFLPTYVAEGLMPEDPFVSLDQAGVGALVEMAVARGRSVRPDLHCGICGEHGGDPKSIHFFAKVGLDYVSCSPYRVPVARLAAAQAAITQGAKSSPERPNARARKLGKTVARKKR